MLNIMDKIKDEPDLYKKALLLVNELFKDKYDKSNMPYLDHLYFVSDFVNSEEEKVVGLLHDTLEDTNIVEKDLLELGFPQYIVDSVKILTKNKEIPYDEYIKNVLDSGNQVSIRVKRADMVHNLNYYRLNKLDEKVRNQLINKYIPAYEKIENYLKER